jgi:hypothetical protein
VKSGSREDRALEIQRAIGAILLQYWDPIGIRDVPEMQDEYDSYVGPVYRLLASGASTDQIAKHLADVETSLGVKAATPAQLFPVAARLAALDVSLRGKAG